MIRALVDANGDPVAFYDDRLQTPPQGTVAMPLAVWRRHFGGTPQRWMGGAWVDAAWQPTLDEYKQFAIERITEDFRAAAAAGHTCANGITMNSGRDDVLLFDAGVRMNEQAGATHMTIADFNNATHSVTVAEARRMVGELAANLQALLNRKWALRDRIMAAASRAEVDQVVW